MKKYWYKIYIGECPLCGRDAGYRERQYTPRPDNKDDRIVFLALNESYCGCPP